MITKIGKTRLEAELTRLKTELDRTLVERALAAKEGDLKENSAYISLGEQAELLRSQIIDYSGDLQKAKIINPPTSANKVELGHWVELEFADGKKLKICPVGEHDSSIKPGWISLNSPLAISLMGKKVGESGEVNGRPYKVLSIEIADLE